MSKIVILFLSFRHVVEVEKQPKTIVIPRYQPVFVEPNLKEYETQVLQMSVPIDDADRMFDFSTATRNGGGGGICLHFQLFVYNIKKICFDFRGEKSQISAIF